MTTITITNKSSINACGRERNGNAKPVFCITNGKIYTSGVDMARELNLSMSEISKCCRGVSPHTKGYRMCFAKDAVEHITEISDSIQSKANELEKYSDLIAEREAEERRKIEEKKRQEKLAKLKEKHSRDKEKYDRMRNRANKAWTEMAATESQIRQLENASLF